MKTIKLPYISTKEQQKLLKELMREYSIVVRSSYNKYNKGLEFKQIREHIKKLNNINNLNVYMIWNAIKEGERYSKLHPGEKIVFGGKSNFKLRSQNKITKKEWKNKRQLGFYIIGEANVNGNRHFKFDTINNNQIIFRIGNNKYPLQLPKLRKHWKKELFWLENQANQKLIPITIRLDEKYIYISFQEQKKESQNIIKDRYLSIDINPNYIGYSIIDNKDNKILDKGIFDLKQLNEKLNVSSSDKKQSYQNNKRKYEIFEISKSICNKAVYYHCEKIIIENLEIKSKDHKKGKIFNRLVNNNWNRRIFVQNLKKRCNINNIQLFEVFPHYSSFIGNTFFGNENTPDPIASSLELNRRAYSISTGEKKFYPDLISKDQLPIQWKDDVVGNYSDWKGLFSLCKESKVKYRFPLIDSVVFSHKHINSCVEIHKFI